MRRVFFLFFLSVLFSVSIPAFSQTAFSGFKKLSCPEKWWVVSHPFIAKRAWRITNEVRESSKEMEQSPLLDGDADGGQVDAFRHAYWMARLSQEICWRKARSLGKAHEKGNFRDFKKKRAGEEIFSDSVSCAMDLFNNAAGIATGRESKKLPAEEVKKIILESVRAGKMKIILKDREGFSLSCEHARIDLKSYSGIWNIPRCLTRSDAKRQ